MPLHNFLFASNCVRYIFECPVCRGRLANEMVKWNECLISDKYFKSDSLNKHHGR